MPPDPRIVVFGDVFDDVVVVPSHAIRPDTDTLSSIRTRAGGSAANTAAWLGSLGAPVDFVGLVGAGDSVRHAAQLPGVTAHLEEHSALPTGTIVVIVEGETRTMLTDVGANAELSADSVTDALVDAASLIHFTGYSLFGSPQRADAVARLFARAGDTAISVDPGSAGFIADFGAERFLDAIDGATFLFPNLEEGRLLTGLDDPLAIALSLAQRFEIVALTLDTEGVIVAQRGQGVDRLPTVPAQIVDPTGAGDAFAAGFLAEWLRSHDAVAAARAGALAGSWAVATIGARPK
ncbi:MAG: PfkB family carbohydrate kinase [Actinomycetota bacterium]